MIRVSNLKIRDTKHYWWARVTATNHIRSAIGTRQVNRTEPFALSRAVQWAQENAISQLKNKFV